MPGISKIKLGNYSMKEKMDMQKKLMETELSKEPTIDGLMMQF